MLTDSLIASRTAALNCNAIREILKVVSQPGMISLAGGIPAPESFPLAIMGELTQRVLDTHQAAALQYDCTEGFEPLREALGAHLAPKGITATADDILIASGSQGVLDAIGKVLIEPGDRIAVESPTYLGALQAFNPYEPQYVALATDDDGLIPTSLETMLKKETIKFIYAVPSFQNPTGRTLPLGRRREIAGLLTRYDAVLIEDDPYSALRYEGEEIPPIKAMAPENVIYISSFSKIFAPGLRIGYCVAPKAIRKWLTIVKQGVDLHTSTFGQALAAEYLAGGYLDRHLPTIRDLYRPRQRAMLAALDRYLPAGFSWSRPQGGMFVWVEGPRGMDMEKIYWEAVARHVAFVPGKFFHCEPDKGRETMRLNFTMADESTIDRAVRSLARAIIESTDEYHMEANA